MIIDELTVGMVQTRCYILSPEGGQECIVIDPGDEAARIRKAVGERKIAAILLTHGHFDHIYAADRLRELSGAKILPGKVFSPKASERELKDWVRTLPL